MHEFNKMQKAFFFFNFNKKFNSGTKLNVCGDLSIYWFGRSCLNVFAN